MLTNEKKDKLIELASKAASVNTKLLAEERKFIEAVAQHADIVALKKLSDSIKELNRKETLFIGATIMVLKSSGTKE
jgi:hypothetical protein